MPTYDYVCQACDHAFELVQSMRDPVKRACPACKKRKLKRLIGTGLAILIGGKGTPEPTSSPTDSKANHTKSETKTSKTEEPKEKTISGSTSTPTHEAREGRGIGNLKDAAKRTRQENAKKTTPPASSGPKSSTPSKAKTSAKPKKTPVKRSVTQPKPKNSGRTNKRA